MAFGDMPTSMKILIWTRQAKRSHWCASVTDAARAVDRLRDRSDVYFGCGLASRDYGERKRVPAAEVAALVGLWADVDFAAPTHADTSKTLPPDRKSAIAVLDAMPMRPTVTTFTGGGLQAFWLFREPWVFENAAERAKAAALSEGWNMLLRNHALNMGWDVDSVFDLARVMRVPGTFNRKSAEAIPVEMLSSDDDRRYNPEEMDEHAVRVTPQTRRAGKGKVSAAGGQIRIAADASPALDKLEALRENDEMFEASWQRKRSKKEMTDQSASAYNLSLANIAVMAGWSDQEIVDLMIAWRRKHGEDIKVHETYYLKTLSKARGQLELTAAEETLDEAMELGIDVEADPDGTGHREKLLDSLSEMFGIRIDRVLKIMAAEPRFELVTELGQIVLGDIDAVMGQAKFRNRVAAATNRIVPPCKGPKWTKRAQAMLDACETIDVGPDATREGSAELSVMTYLESYPPGDMLLSESSRHPFQHKGHVYFFLNELKRHVGMRTGDRVNVRDLSSDLRNIGCVPMVKRLGTSTRHVWRLPDHMAEDVERGIGIGDDAANDGELVQ